MSRPLAAERPVVSQTTLMVEDPEPTFRKIAGALARTRVVSAEARTIVSYAAGALFGLRRAHVLGFVDSAQPISEEAKSAELASVIGALQVPYGSPSQEWTAGWYFNSAIHRIDAAHARLLALMNRRRANQRDAPEGTVARDVGDLKHRPQGLAERRSVSFTKAMAELSALAERLEDHFRRAG